MSRGIVSHAIMRGFARRGARGFSLIELMIAMVLGLLVAEGIYVLFAAAGKVNATQTALARLQENGRVAIDFIANDLRAAARLPCGSQAPMQVYADELPKHVSGNPTSARAPADATQAYALDRDVFLGGSRCQDKTCSPTVPGVPRAGLGTGDQVPGTDVLLVRSLQGDGLPVAGARQTCSADGRLAAIAAPHVADDSVLSGLQSSHLALLAGCTQAQVFAVTVQGDSVQPAAGQRGAPMCSADAQTRLYDLDTQLQTTIYYLQLTADDTSPGHKISALMRRTNGVASEVVQGVERLDLRYSLTDAAGNAHWLSADELSRHVGADGAALQCRQADALAPCSWKDVDAVEIALLANTVENLPAESSANAWDFRYSIDGADMQRPAATMPVTGLPAGRMLRREFRTVVALRGLAT